MLEYINYIKKNNLGKIYTNKTFKDITTIKIGGKISLLYYPNTTDNFIKFYNFYLKSKTYPIIVLGNGSNILANSDDFFGIVVSFKKVNFKYAINNNLVTVSSGVMINDLINFLKKNNIGGLEKLYLIPATIGGMIKMNAGAYNYFISDNLISIKGINKLGEVKKYSKYELEFDYRKTNIKDIIILEAIFKLNNSNSLIIEEKIKKIKKDRIDKQPLDQFNAGSTFKNTNDYKAWYLIDKVGLRGYSIKDASISNKHCNFLINKKNSKSEDMIKLINYVIKQVKQEYNIILECEWNFINFKKSVYFS